MIVSARPAPRGGALRDRHGRWRRDAMDAGRVRGEHEGRGRPSRVVLAPRRWRQAGGAIRLRRGLSSPAPRGERGAAVKTIARGMPVVSAALSLLACVKCTSLHARPAGAASIRHSLRPPSFEGEVRGITRAESRRGSAESRVDESFSCDVRHGDAFMIIYFVVIT
jgi:hypothetical protein